MSAIVTVRLNGSNDTLPWLALPPLARICSNAASTWVGDPMLHIELEAEEPGRRDHDSGDQPDQDLFALGQLRCR